VGENPGEPNFPDLGGWNDVLPGYTTNENGVPGWTVNHRMIRKTEVTIGRFAGATVFNTGAEWDSTAAPGAQSEDPDGVFESLGFHNCACDPTSNTVDRETAPGTLFPNPVDASEMLRFTAPYQTLRYEIYDLTGKRVAAETTINSETFDIPVTKLETGVYILRTYAGNGAYVNKFVVQ